MSYYCSKGNKRNRQEWMNLPLMRLPPSKFGSCLYLSCKALSESPKDKLDSSFTFSILVLFSVTSSCYKPPLPENPVNVRTPLGYFCFRLLYCCPWINQSKLKTQSKGVCICARWQAPHPFSTSCPS